MALTKRQQLSDVEFSGDVSFESGSSIDIESGSTLKIAGTQVTASAAELNMLDGASCVIKVLRVALTAGTTTTGGDVLSVANPEGADCIITRLIVDVTTPATGVATADFGVAADGETSSDTLLDGVDIGTAAALFDNADATDQGDNGKLIRTWADDEFVTGTPSATAAGLVGYAYIHYHVA